MEIGRYTLDQIKPALRPSIDAGILEMAEDAADQVGDREREEVISSVLSRFSSWITTQPNTRRPPRSGKIPTPLINEPLEERRRQVLLHMGIRFSGMLSRLQALDDGALAMMWQASRHEEYGYDPPHPGRDGQIYLVRGSWALERGLIQPGPAGFLDEVAAPGVEHYCRCSCKWLFSLRSLPDMLLTDVGRSELSRARQQFAINLNKPD